MFTISDIMADINRGCAVNNLNENAFSYRIVFFVNEDNASKKYCVDSAYGGLRKTIESIIRENLTLTDTVSVTQTTVFKGGKCVSLLSRAYKFSLDEYFRQIYGNGRKRSPAYGRCAANAR